MRIREMEDKKIVIAVNDLEVMAKTLPSMVEWVKKLRGKVSATLLYVANVSDMEAGIHALEDMKIKDLQLTKLAKDFTLHGIPAESKVTVGVPANEIVREARKKRAFAILMSTAGRGRLSNVLFGSTVEAVIRGTPCPVVVFKPRLLRFTEKIGAALSSRIKKLHTNAALNNG